MCGFFFGGLLLGVHAEILQTTCRVFIRTKKKSKQNRRLIRSSNFNPSDIFLFGNVDRLRFFATNFLNIHQKRSTTIIFIANLKTGKIRRLPFQK